uniref:Fucosyltransferase n=1 Tax=Trichuris muris TaxID=70415 RepID=A0A5S6QI81_TRIMR
MEVKRMNEISVSRRLLGTLSLSALLCILMINGGLRSPFNNNENFKRYFVTHVTILDWTTFFGRPLNSTDLRLCPELSCEITNDRKKLKTSNAVLFHPRDIEPQDLPAGRPSHLHYVFFLQESPHHVNLKLTASNFFTLTMTYRRDSDVHMPYGWMRRTQKEKTNFSSEEFIEGILLHKRRLVAAFVSNCGPPSGRDTYIRALQQYVRVDVYGRCGPLYCPKEQSEKCLSMLRKEYKFILAFENSVCKDYVTEKVFNALKYNVVPVVLSRRITEPFLPNGSFIAADDFPTAEELARYLRQLDNDTEEYLKYFDWLKSYEIIGYDDMQSLAFCQLCRLLRDTRSTAVKASRSAEDIVKWYHVGGNCLINYGKTISGVSPQPTHRIIRSVKRI